LSLVGHTRSSERGTETFGHWSDTVHRQRMSTETFCHWLDTADRQKGYIDVWSLDRCSRSSARGSEMLGHWLDTVDRQKGILRRLVTGWIQ